MVSGRSDRVRSFAAESRSGTGRHVTPLRLISDAAGTTGYMLRRSILLLVAAAVALTAQPPSVGRAQSGDQVLATQSCSSGRPRPTRIVFACADFGLYVDHLRWSSWGGRVAVGRGIYHFNDCDPACVSGHFHMLGATLHLFTRRTCPDRTHLYYQRATMIRSDGRRERGFVGCPT